MKYYQQGDVLFFVVGEVKGKMVNPETIRGFVFAEGETTGHYHAVKETEGVKVYEENGTKYCAVEKESAVVEHQEHGAITLPKGTYKISIVKEFDPFEQEISNVRD